MDFLFLFYEKYGVNVFDAPISFQYMESAVSLPMFGYVHFQPCVCDYPNSNTPAQIAVGRRELVMKVRTASGELKEGSFKVRRKFDLVTILLLG